MCILRQTIVKAKGQMNSQKKRDIASVIVRLVLLGFSLLSWSLTLVGVIKIYGNIEEKSEDNGKLKGLQQALNFPYVLLLLGAIPNYLLTVIHMIYHFKNKNRAHIVHSIMMAYYPATMATGGAGVFMGVVYILGGETIQNILRLDPVAMKIALSGTVLMMIFQWISSSIWPLFNFERHPHRQDYQELEESTNFK